MILIFQKVEFLQLLCDLILMVILTFDKFPVQFSILLCWCNKHSQIFFVYEIHLKICRISFCSNMEHKSADNSVVNKQHIAIPS